MRLFCFPYAGGGATAYRHWWNAFPETMEVCSVLPPGREQRLSEPPLSTMEEYANGVLAALEGRLDLPFAFFGHSLGALVAFETARRLRGRGMPMPEHLFVSACRAPHLPFRNRPMHDLTDEEFVAQLRVLKGTPEEALNHPELMALMLPALRGDFTVFETYRYEESPRLPMAITALGGDSDHRVSEAELAAWKEQTSAAFSQRSFGGDHFYLHTMRQELIPAIAEKLKTMESIPVCQS